MANPATEWAELDVPNDESRENDYAKGELKAMIERKRRNDFVRKREFDMLRKVRREGLSGEQLAALGGSSRIDDSQPRISDQPVRQDAGVKAKIDEIEQQMVGDGYSNTQRRAPEFYNAPTQPAPLDLTAARPSQRRHAGAGAGPAQAPASAPAASHGGRVEDFVKPAPVAVAPPPPPCAGAGLSRRLGGADPPRDADGRGLRQGLFRQQHRSHARSRPRRGGDRLRQRRLRAVRAGAVGPHRPRRQPRPARRDLARALRPLPRDRPAAQVREPRARLRPAVRLVGAAVVLDAQAGRRGGERRAADQLAHRRPGRLGLPQLPRRRRRRAARVAGPADAAALGVRLGRAADDRRRGERPPVRALPQLDAAGPRHALALAASACSPCCRKQRPPATATPTRRTGSFASTRCA